jgi:hypothetical protein
MVPTYETDRTSLSAAPATERSRKSQWKRRYAPQRTASLGSANRRFDCNARCRLLLLVNIRLERGLIGDLHSVVAGLIDTAHRVYTAPLPLARLPGKLSDKLADSNAQMSVCVKAVNFPLRQRKPCPRAKPPPRHGACVTTQEDLGEHAIASKATNDTHLLLYKFARSGAKAKVMRCDANLHDCCVA